MGARGPVPKRSSQRRRRNKESTPEQVEAPATKVEQPAADSDWHDTAKAWYESLAVSGQAIYYEPSDWQLAYIIAESLSRDLKPQWVGINEESGESVYAVIPLKGQALNAYLKAMGSLLCSEGDRRRAKMEIQRGPVTAPSEADEVARLDDYRDRAAG